MSAVITVASSAPQGSGQAHDIFCKAVLNLRVLPQRQTDREDVRAAVWGVPCPREGNTAVLQVADINKRYVSSQVPIYNGCPSSWPYFPSWKP
jgi:hypothetical protein